MHLPLSTQPVVKKEDERLTAAQYQHLSNWFQKRPKLLRLLAFCCKRLPLALYAGYPVLLLLLLFMWDPRFWRVLYAPAAAFLLITLLRRVINAKRPYEQPGFVPLVSKDTRGKSFPSRHAGSAAAITAAFWYIHPVAGVVCAVISLILCAARPLAGVHFVRDVVFGVLIGLAVSVPLLLFPPL